MSKYYYPKTNKYLYTERLDKLFKMASIDVKDQDFHYLNKKLSYSISKRFIESQPVKYELDSIRCADEVSLLHIAMKSNNWYLVALLVNMGCDIDYKYQDVSTPYDMAIQKISKESSKDIIKMINYAIYNPYKLVQKFYFNGVFPVIEDTYSTDSIYLVTPSLKYNDININQELDKAYGELEIEENRIIEEFDPLNGESDLVGEVS